MPGTLEFSLVLSGIIGSKVLYIINDWSTYTNNLSEIFSINTLQAGGVFSRRIACRVHRGCVVRPQASHARAGNL